MKKTLMIACCLFVSLCGAQQDIYQKVNAFVKQSDPTLMVQNKVMVVNFVEANLNDDKSVYSTLEKTANVYGGAKLKGGKNGVICVAVVSDTQAQIALNKKGYKNLHVITKSQLENADVSGIDNITFNSNGEVVFKNLEPGKIYEAINQLITR
ncbi:MAG: hypothetical protein SGJ15_08730 [Bacteroidota bacterium]|nr:hypothetical protein [Bacteroidota bacterium]